MLTDIFSAFDPATTTMFNNFPSPTFWGMNLLFLLTFTSNFWATPTSLTQLIMYPKEIMSSQTKRTTGTHLKGLTPLLSALFIFTLSINLTGLFPYVFSTTSHLFFTMSLAIPIWFSLILSSLYNSPSSFAAGILPGGAPDWLNPFLVMVETLSILVRPITLSFRLAANMSAGHIVLGLIGTYGASALLTSTNISFTLISIQTLYIMFELGICLIQAYIFCLLLSLYSDDHTTL